jgi:hypothetical protein
MKAAHYTAVGLVCLFFILVFAVAFAYQPHYPMLVLTGESSVGTWMSGALLLISATIALIIGMREGWFPWYIVTVFFFVLALDERFMFHERLKAHIIFSIPAASRWLYELPVMLGACVGAVATVVLWRVLAGGARVALACATALGIASVSIDILAAGVFWEECFKLVAELFVVCALLSRTNVKS